MSRNLVLDYLKVVMAFMVVFLHSKLFSDVSYEISFFFVNGLFRIAVPIFFIINGYYFFDVYRKGLLNVWLMRVFKLYLFWMFIYIWFWLDFSGGGLGVVKDLLFGFHHLWYVAALFYSAIVLLFMVRFNKYIFVFALVLLYLFGVLVQYLGNYHYFDGGLDKIFNYDWVHRNAIFFGVPFFGVGFLLHKHSLTDRVSFSFVVLLVFLFSGFFGLEVYFNAVNQLNEGGFDNYLMLLPLCVFLFLLVQNINIYGSTKSISLYSSGVYFLHILFLRVLESLFVLNTVLLSGVTLILTSILVLFIINKTKFGRSIF